MELLGVAQDQKNLAFKMRFAPNTLSSYLKSKGRLSVGEAKFYLGQILLALDYMHK